MQFERPVVFAYRTDLENRCEELQKVFSRNLLYKFSVHNITVRHNALLSEHTVTDRHSTVCYVRSVYAILL